MGIFGIFPMNLGILAFVPLKRLICPSLSFICLATATPPDSAPPLPLAGTPPFLPPPKRGGVVTPPGGLSSGRFLTAYTLINTDIPKIGK